MRIFGEQNTNSQAGSKPDAKKCLDALKIITLGQYTSEEKNANYVHDEVIFLLNFICERLKSRHCRVYNYDFLAEETFHSINFDAAFSQISPYNLSTW